MSEESPLALLKQFVIGKPIPSHLAHHERLSKKTGLAVLSSDALSSVAYATEEILRVLMLAGVGALSLVTPIGTVIAVLLLIVAFSYWQTIHAYPSGGGAYIVARENLGVQCGLVAGSALLVDYVLTVAVSIAAGVAAITSAFPEAHTHRVALALAFVAIIAIGNLRGVRESGIIFAIPTYFFLCALLGTLAVGGFRVLTGTLVPMADVAPAAAHPLTLFLLLRAFANGCTAMTGVEAISNGVPAFKPPEAKNASLTLVIMSSLCVTLFMGLTLLAHAYQVVPSETETVISQVARSVFGGRGVPYYAMQIATTLILVLAANTAYADFPRLASILARDGFLPRQFMSVGDRLAFSNGIVVLSALAAILLAVFAGDTHSLIPLYMIGVFVSFTLSQTGMVLKWRRERPPGWMKHAAVNAVGGLLTGLVLLVVAVTKFEEGAWLIIAIIPVLVLAFRSIKAHYDRVAGQLSMERYVPEPVRRNVVLVPIGGVHRAVVAATAYAHTLSADVRGVYVGVDERATEKVQREWERWTDGVPLVVLASPYRSLTEPLLEYVEEVQAENTEGFVTVLLPEFIPARWWHHLLHNQQALLIKGALYFRSRIVVTSVPFHLVE